MNLGNVTISLVEAGLLLLFIAIVILLIFCMVLVKNLTGTVQQTNKILEDVQVVTKISAERAQDVDKIITDVAESASNLSSALKSNQGTIASIASLFKSIASLKNTIKK